ncbi:SDR family oxidoreductase [archaeon]|nr:SDR family oxidoreductase [archaeon]
MTKFLVTGGAGFIGSNIVDYLVSNADNKVVVIDDLSTGKIENLKDIKDKIEFHQQTILDLDFLKQVMKDVDYVLHQAAIPSVAKSVKDPLKTHQVNIDGTLNILIAARDSGVKRVVYASSSSVYGDQKGNFKHESMTPQPLSPYATQKLMGEHYCKNFNNLYGLKTVCLRYFNVFGPRQDPKAEYSAVIPAFITKILRREQPIIYGDGAQSRDFTYVDDVLQANILACESQDAPGEVFNIAYGNSTSLNDLLLEINQILSTDIKPKRVEPRPGDVKQSCADISKAQQLLGYHPSTRFILGLERTIEWYKDNKV